jgi:hypothetical protein
VHYFKFEINQPAPQFIHLFLYRSLFLLLVFGLREAIDLARWLIWEKQSGFAVLWMTNHANNSIAHNLSYTLAVVFLFIIRIFA